MSLYDCPARSSFRTPLLRLQLPICTMASQVQNPKTETRPAEAHRCLYREVNYTEELKDEIARVRGVKPSQATQIQGFYDAKIITLRDTTLKTQIQQISLFKALQQFHLKSMRAL